MHSLEFVKRYLLPRLIFYILTIFVGLSLTFLLTRFLPIDPIQQVLGTLSFQGAYMDPEAVKILERTLKELFGLTGNLIEQFYNFWKRVLKGDWGPSLYQFPTPITDLIRLALPWTVGLLSTATLISWLLGLLIGSLLGYYRTKGWSRYLRKIFMVIRPFPYYLFALLMLILFTYLMPVFPLGGSFRITGFNLPSILRIIKSSFLPALSLILLWIIGYSLNSYFIVQDILMADYVKFAKIGGVAEGRIFRKYIIRNTMLPQMTLLALSMSQIFGGALITETVFSYPGLGTLAYKAITSGDYNLLLAITSFSVIAITTGTLTVDLLYPLVDPRVRYYAK